MSNGIKSGALALAAAAGALALTAPVRAAAFTNGDFEQPGGRVRNQLGDGDPAPVTGTADFLTGWGHSGGFEIYESDDTGDLLAAQSGTHYVSFGHNGAIGGSLFQTFDTIAGQIYTINYYAAEQQGDDPLQNLQATLTNGLETITQDNLGLSSAFTLGGPIVFTAQGSSATITFLDATASGNGGGSNLALDSVSLTTGSATPEPASWGMMVVGFGLLGAAMRRRTGDSLFA